MRVMIMDTETGGLDPDKYSLLEVAAVVIDLSTGEELDHFDAKHRLPSVKHYRTSPKALEINKLTVEDCFENGVETGAICDKLVSMFKEHGCVAVGGQNFGFDIPFLARRLFRVTDDEWRRTFSRQGRFNLLDTLPIARMLTGILTTKNFKLESLVKAFGVDMSDVKGDYHSALKDTIATARLLYKQRECLRMGFENPVVEATA